MPFVVPPEAGAGLEPVAAGGAEGGVGVCAIAVDAAHKLSAAKQRETLVRTYTSIWSFETPLPV
jgi:hypothetical protein